MTHPPAGRPWSIVVQREFGARRGLAPPFRGIWGGRVVDKAPHSERPQEDLNSLIQISVFRSLVIDARLRKKRKVLGTTLIPRSHNFLTDSDVPFFFQEIWHSNTSKETQRSNVQDVRRLDGKW